MPKEIKFAIYSLNDCIYNNTCFETANLTKNFINNYKDKG